MPAFRGCKWSGTAPRIGVHRGSSQCSIVRGDVQNSGMAAGQALWSADWRSLPPIDSACRLSGLLVHSGGGGGGFCGEVLRFLLQRQIVSQFLGTGELLTYGRFPTTRGGAVDCSPRPYYCHALLWGSVAELLCLCQSMAVGGGNCENMPHQSFKKAERIMYKTLVRNLDKSISPLWNPPPFRPQDMRQLARSLHTEACHSAHFELSGR